MTTNRLQPGFTLIEFLIYFFILGIVVLSISAVLFNVMTSTVQLETVQETGQNASVIMESIADRVRNAQSITTPSIGTSGTTLRLQMADSTINPTIFVVSSGVLTIKEGSDTAIPLHTDEVRVAGITITNVSYEDQPGSVRIQLILESADATGKQEYENQETFYTTVTIRPK